MTDFPTSGHKWSCHALTSPSPILYPACEVLPSPPTFNSVRIMQCKQ